MTGRELPPSSPFAGDDGTADPAVAAALAALDTGVGSVAAVVDALAGTRVLVPVLAELEVVAGMLDRDLGRELLAVRDHFADTPTTTGARRAPNPAVGQSLALARAIAGQLVEALSVSVMTRQPERLEKARRIVAALREG